VAGGVCAIDASRKVIRLRLLHGEQLIAPPGLLRPGSTTIGTLDFWPDKVSEAELVSERVGQAVRARDEVKVDYPAERSSR